MELVSLLKGIWDAKEELQALIKTVKANPKQCQRLWERIDAMTPGLNRIDVNQKALRQARPSSAAQSKPLPPDPNLPPLVSALRDAVKAAVSLVAQFCDAGWFQRVLRKSDYSDEFASVNNQLTQAQTDLGFCLQVSDQLSRQHDAADARADLTDIKSNQLLILSHLDDYAVEHNEAFDAQQRRAEQFHQQAMSVVQEQQQFLADRFQSMDKRARNADAIPTAARTRAQGG